MIVDYIYPVKDLNLSNFAYKLFIGIIILGQNSNISSISNNLTELV